MRRAITVELKDVRVPALTTQTDLPHAFSQRRGKAVSRKRACGGLDYTFQPGRTVALHFHDKDTVAIFLGAGKIQSRTSGGIETVQEVKTGSVLFSPRERTHSEETVQGAPRAIVIERK